MLQTIQGIIFRTIKYSESSVNCEVYTQEHGLRTYIMNGVRQQKSKIGPALVQPMALVEMVVYHREDRDINRVKEIKPAYIYHKIPFDVLRGAIGLFITEIAQKSIKESVENPDLYEFLATTYQMLDSLETRLANFHLSFMVKLTQYLGFMPEGVEFEVEGLDFFFDYREGEFLFQAPPHTYYFPAHHSRLLLQFLEQPMNDCAHISITGNLRHDFIEDMIRFYQYHIENLKIYSHDVLHQVLG